MYAEPRGGSGGAGAFADVFARYTADCASARRNGRHGGGGDGPGAILFAVHRGKLSEGVNFTDGMTRLVVAVGVPYQPVKAPEVAAQRRYSGEAWYADDAIRTVAQGAGRCLRHRGDWGAALLLDARYAAPVTATPAGSAATAAADGGLSGVLAANDVRGRLPRWLRDAAVDHDDIDGVCAALATFARVQGARHLPLRRVGDAAAPRPDFGVEFSASSPAETAEEAAARTARDALVRPPPPGAHAFLPSVAAPAAPRPGRTTPAFQAGPTGASSSLANRVPQPARPAPTGSAMAGAYRRSDSAAAKVADAAPPAAAAGPAIACRRTPVPQASFFARAKPAAAPSRPTTPTPLQPCVSGTAPPPLASRSVNDAPPPPPHPPLWATRGARVSTPTATAAGIAYIDVDAE